MSFALHDLLGALGVLLIVGTYLLLQLGRIEARGVAYPAWNALGAGLILYSLAFAFNLSAVIVEGFWLAMSLFGVFMGLRRRRADKTA